MTIKNATIISKISEQNHHSRSKRGRKEEEKRTRDKYEDNFPNPYP
jgi:hypothetical protein